jgi:alginate O-acetyltransferase complex protein AlgI
VKKCLAALQKRVSGEKLLNLAEPIALCVLLVVMTGYLVDGSFSPFLYFRF